MINYYSLEIIPIILKRFKVNNVIISGESDDKTINQILSYCGDCDDSNGKIDPEQELNFEFINNFTLNELPNFKNYDAIFLNDDPNWYTIFNELNIIKENNHEFPLVFICNNVFPHKRRDSYSNPGMIPNEFLNEYSKNLNYNGITLHDGLFHAVEESTPNNGVATAIEDFLNENPSIGLMNIKLLEGITILYHMDNISYIRLGRLFEEIEGYELEWDDLSDNIFENQILINNIAKFNIFDEDGNSIDDIKIEIQEKDMIINDFENKIKINNSELSLKDSQIENFSSELNLRETQFKNIESKLVNKDFEINHLNNQLNDMHIEMDSLKSDFRNRELDLNNQINSLKSNISQIEERESGLKNQLQVANDKINDNIAQLNNKNEDILLKDNQIRTNELKLIETQDKLNSFKYLYTNQLSKLDNREYCITCYKDEINNNHVEIEYLKKRNLIKKILSPFAYVYILSKSNLNELSLNFKLYKALKNSKCFDIGYYLNNNNDIKNSKWCKYFSPELHYVCNGFNEGRRFNKKYFNRNSKKELLDYIINCS